MKNSKKIKNNLSTIYDFIDKINKASTDPEVQETTAGICIELDYLKNLIK